MSPLIGITSEYRPMVREGWPWNGHFLLTHYTQALQAAGGLPVILPLAHVDTCEDTLSRLDGLMITGGLDDVPPQVLAKPPPTLR